MFGIGSRRQSTPQVPSDDEMQRLGEEATSVAVKTTATRAALKDEGLKWATEMAKKLDDDQWMLDGPRYNPQAISK